MGKRKSKGNGEGTIYVNSKTGLHIGQYVVNGKRHSVYQKKNEKVGDFKKRFNAILNDINSGTYIGKSKITVYSIIKEHIEQKFKDGITKENSYGRDLDTLKQIENCCSIFINKPIQQVSLKDIQTAKEEIKSYSQSNIDKIWRLLKKAFSIAASPSFRLIPFNIMDDENLKKPTSEKKTKKVYPLQEEERKRLQSILDNEEYNHPYRDIVKMQWITAMRIGEVLARSETDVNKDDLTLHIHNTITKDKDGKIILGEHTKTYNKKTEIDEGERYFPIDTELNEIIKRQLDKKMVNVYGLLFWNYERNTFINPKRINEWLERINKRYKISSEKLHSHRLRHDRITQWKEAGIDMSAIQYLAGHIEDSEVTDVYIDVSQNFAFEQLKKAN